MYAVLVTGGKQYRVLQGETLRVEKLDVEAGSEITFDSVLLMGGSDGIQVGEALQGASVTAKVVAHGRARKVKIIKFRRRKHHEASRAPAVLHRNPNHRYDRAWPAVIDNKE